MRTTRTTETSTVGREVQAAIDSLTALVGAERETPDGMTARYDMGEIVARVLTCVAANVGGLGPFLNAKPDSEQAYYVRQLVSGTVPLEQLLSHRTAPVRLHLDLAGLFFRHGAAWAFDEEWAVVQLAVRHAEDDTVSERARALAGAMVKVYEADKQAYRRAYEAVVRDELTRRGLPAHIEVAVVDAAQVDVNGGEGDAWWDELAGDLHQHADQRMPLPAVLVDAEGLGYTERALRLLPVLTAQNAGQATVAGEA